MIDSLHHARASVAVPLDSYCSPIHRLGVPRLGDELGCQVLWRATQRVGLAAGRDALGKAKVGDLQVAVGLYQQVLRLEVPAGTAQRSTAGPRAP